MKTEEWIIIVLTICIIFLTIPYYFIDFDFEINKLTTIPYKMEDCHNLSLEDSVYCLRDFVSDFYNYTIVKDTERTIEDIKNNGGDCYDYSHLYQNLATSLNLKSKIISIFPDEDEGHSFIVIWDNNLTSYCIVDGLIVSCRRFI